MESGNMVCFSMTTHIYNTHIHTRIVNDRDIFQGRWVVPFRAGQLLHSMLFGCSSWHFVFAAV